MNKRIILKTVLVCTGLFIIFLSITSFYVFHNYTLTAKTQEYRVLVANASIDEGTIISPAMLSSRAITQSALNSYMVCDLNDVVGQKAISKINSGDYIRNYCLLPQNMWYSDQDRFIVVPMDIETRLANLIKQGSLVDVKVSLNGVKSVPKIVLSRVKIEDLLDETGKSLDASSSSKKAFAKFVLGDEQRNRLYIASQLGKLSFELYCDSMQKPATETFIISPEYVNQLNQEIDSTKHKEDLALKGGD